MEEGIRLNKYLASCGVASRRGADKLIEEGRVTIEGRIARPGDIRKEGAEVMVDGHIVSMQEKVVLAYYKPAGVLVSEDDPHAEETLKDLIDYPVRVTYAGRLDKDSEGLLILTNDGDLIHAMMHGSHGHEKEYIVHLNKEPDNAVIEKLRGGVYLKEPGVKTRPCRIEKISRNAVRMVLTEGINRQIRRMWSQEGYHVKALKRVRIMGISLGNLMPGEYSELTKKEMESLYRQAGLAG
ncbi:MAG: rRNA pseudouridine synthase [Lachnospiraceae bacterium]|nr:rRNA pseudouridine synthase [Lachnospiraceae bacterium]